MTGKNSLKFLVTENDLIWRRETGDGNNSEQNLRDLWDNLKKVYNLRVMKFQKEKRENGTKNSFRE